MAPVKYPSHHADTLKGLHAIDFNKITRRKEAENILNGYVGDFRTKQFLLKNIYWKDSAGGSMAWRFNLASITKNYGEITAEVPNSSCDTQTLFLRGEKSQYVKDEDLGEIKKRFPNYILETIPGAGHWLHAEKPGEFYNSVIKFL